MAGARRTAGVWAGVAVLAIALVAAPSALAKGPDTARICGESSCVTLSGPENVNTLALLTAGFSSRSEPAPASFYTVELTSSRVAAVKWQFLYVPSARALKIVTADFSGHIAGDSDAVENSWVTPAAEVAAAYGDAVGGLEPFAANSAWHATPAGDGWNVPWVPLLVALAVVLAAAAAVAGRVVTRRAARLAHD